MIQPRGWQTVALQKFKLSTKPHFLLDATPGSGKTLFSGFAAQYLIERRQIDFALAITPTTVVKGGDGEAGFQGDWNKLGLQLTTVLKDGRDMPTEYCSAAITYQQLPNMLTTLETWIRNGARLFVVFDEVHHASEDNRWGEATDTLGKIAVRTLSMTGTCFRGDERKIAFVDYDENDKAKADYTYSYREAVSDDVCRSVYFITDDSVTQYVLDNEEQTVRVSEAKTTNHVRGATRTVFRSDHDFLPQMFVKADAKLDEYRTWDIDAGGLVICRSGKDDNDNKHLNYICDSMAKTLGEVPEKVSYNDGDADAKIARFRKSKQRWISAVRIISEGVDIKRLRVLALATRPTTELLFRQLVGRVVRVDDENRPGDAVVFMAKFPQLVEWGERIAEEAKAGLRQRIINPTPGGGDNTGPRIGKSFTSLSATHEDGGALSDYGDHYTSDEINAAERLRSGDPQLTNVSIVTLAYLQRKLGIDPEPAVTAEPPLQIRKKAIRQRIVKRARYLAIKRNSETPDYKLVWRQIGAKFGPRTVDDMMEQYSIDIMQQIESWLSTVIAGENLNDPR